jgi:hypothetical protein
MTQSLHPGSGDAALGLGANLGYRELSCCLGYMRPATEERKMTAMLLRGSLGMSRVVILVLMAALPAASQPVSVDQLRQALATLNAARKSDRAIAQATRSLELTERLTEATLDRMKAEFKPGPDALLSLELLSYSSLFLDPPLTDLPQEPPPDADGELGMMNAAANYVATTLRHMPDFLATRITRAFDDSVTAVSLRSSEMKLMGTANREITYRDGRETVLATTSQTFKSSPEEPEAGLSSQGEFGPILGTVLMDSSKGTVTWSHWEKTETGLAAVFRYKVPGDASHYIVDFCCENDETPNFPGSFYHGTPAYHGSLSVDPDTGAILRVTIEAELPSGPIMRSAVAVEYGPVDIGGKSYICPVRSVAISSSRSYLAKFKRDTTITRVNEVVFTNYHRFGSSLRVLSSPSTP